MHIAVLVNDPDALAAKQTTTLLIREAATRRYAVDVVGVEGLSSMPDGSVRGSGKRVPSDGPSSGEDLVEELRAVDSHTVTLSDADVLLMRTNPARDERRWAHTAALSFAGLLEAQGVLVLNRPEGLLRASDKLYLQRLPAAVRPRTLVSRDAAAIRAFIHDLDGPAVLKPLQGTRGTDVFFADASNDRNLRQIVDVLTRQGLAVVQAFVPGAADVSDDRNLRQIIDVLTRQGPAMVQAFVPDAVDGDTRVVVMDGEILEINGHPAAVRRVPGEGDFRSNLHAGGTPRPATITPPMRTVVEAISPTLRADGLFLVGLDFIGDVIIEVNAFSPGGLYHAERFEEANFGAAIFDAVELRVERMMA